jgi:hypothetical protein
MGCGCLVLLIAIIAAALFTGVIGGISFLAAIMPKARIENFTNKTDTRTINGEFDWGVEVSFDLRSISSDPEDVTVEMKVVCSEGQWTQWRTVHLQPKETQHVTQFFAQPTIAATDIHTEAEVVTPLK